MSANVEAKFESPLLWHIKNNFKLNERKMIPDQIVDTSVTNDSFLGLTSALAVKE